VLPPTDVVGPHGASSKEKAILAIHPRSSERGILAFWLSRVLKKTLLTGCSKMLRYKAPEIPRSEAYMKVRRNDAG
jgi:hypothetical protein